MISLPERGAVCCQPDLSSWPSIAQKNRKTAPNDLLGIDNLSWRMEMLEIAKKYMKSLSMPLPTFKPEAPFILSGHQPYPFHMGVLYKYRLLAENSREDINAFWVSVDTEPSAGFPAKIPSFSREPKVISVKMLPSSEGSFYENSTTNQKEIFDFLSTVKKESGLAPNGRFNSGIAFLEKILNSAPPKKMRDLIVKIRREFGSVWPDNVFEIPLSEICKTGHFFEFVFELLKISDKTLAAFNGILAKYRNDHGLRSKANPFPDLSRKGDFVETLFWIARDGKREPLYSKEHGDGRISILSENSDEISSAEELSEFCDKHGYKIWPRAVSLSIMQKLFLGDFFIHGIGGVKYDRITDSLAKKLFLLEPPLFGAASCTLPAKEADDPSEALAKLLQKKRVIKFHPESFLDKTPETISILERKSELVAEIKKPDADKKSLGVEISALNDRLNILLEPLNKKLEEDISAAEERVALFNAVNDREISYFLYSPEEMPFA